MTELEEVEDALAKALAAGKKDQAAILAKEIVRLESEQKGQTSAKKTAPSFGSYLLDMHKQGLEQSGKQFSGIGSKIREEAEQSIPALRGETSADRMGEYLRDKLNIQRYEPENLPQRLIGEGVKQVSDPTNWIAGPGQQLGVAAKWVGGPSLDAAAAITNSAGGLLGKQGLVKTMMAPFLPAVTAEFAGDVAEKADLPPWAQLAFRGAGGMAGGFANAALGRAGRVGMAAWEHRGGTGGLVDAANKKALGLAEEHVRNTVRAAMEADPALATKIQQMSQQAENVGIDLPLSALVDNPVIAASMRSIASRDSQFAAIYNREFDTAVKQLKEATTGTFGDPRLASKLMANNLGDPRDVRAARIKEQIDERAFRAGESLAPDYAARKLSQEIENLGATRGPRISAVAEQLYRKADDMAVNMKVVVPKEQVRNLYMNVTEETSADVFKTFPNIFEKLQKVFGPTVVPGTDRQTFNNASYSDIRSLQKAVSKAFSELNTNTPSYRTDRAALTRLSKSIDEATAGFPPELKSTLTDAGQKFAYDINAKQFGNEVFDKGMLNPKKAKEWMADPANREAMHNIVDPTTGKPLFEGITEPSAMVAKLMERKDKVDSFLASARNANIADAAKMTPGEIVNKIKADPNFVGDFFRRYGHNKEVLAALRSYMAEDIITAGKPLQELLEDKKNAAAYSRVFGAQFSKKIEELASISNALKENPAVVKFDMDKGVSKDWLEQKINIPASQVFSKLRNPIISKWQALVELGSRSITAATDNVYEQKMKQILLDPKAFTEYMEMLKTAAAGTELNQNMLLKFIKEYGLSEALGMGRNTIRGGMYGIKTEDETGERRWNGQ